MATRHAKKGNKVNGNVLGLTISLRAMRLWKGRDPWDIPTYIIIATPDKTHFLISDDGIRQFKVLRSDVFVWL